MQGGGREEASERRDCDLSLFNDINLQLHANVSNPYTFNINSNKKFSSTVQASLPSTETILFRKKWNYPNTISYRITYTIPAGVKVIKFFTAADCNINFDGYVYLDLIFYNKYKDLSLSVYCEGNAGEYDNSRQTKYIGVTPNKTYNIDIQIDSDADEAHYSSSASIYVYYSAEINTHTPDITDY